jgi:hypothetical protein
MPSALYLAYLNHHGIKHIAVVYVSGPAHRKVSQCTWHRATQCGGAAASVRQGRAEPLLAFGPSDLHKRNARRALREFGDRCVHIIPLISSVRFLLPLLLRGHSAAPANTEACREGDGLLRPQKDRGVLWRASERASDLAVWISPYIMSKCNLH